LNSSRKHWERAQARFQQRLGARAWRQMGGLLAEVARASQGA